MNRKKNKEDIIKELPRSICLSVIKSKDGGFCAEITIQKDVLFTEAETFPELVYMINDAIYTYFEIPRKYLSSMPTYLPLTNQEKKTKFLWPMQFIPINV